jgi:hypothetical protein
MRTVEESRVPAGESTSAVLSPARGLSYLFTALSRFASSPDPRTDVTKASGLNGTGEAGADAPAVDWMPGAGPTGASWTVDTPRPGSGEETGSTPGLGPDATAAAEPQTESPPPATTATPRRAGAGMRAPCSTPLAQCRAPVDRRRKGLERATASGGATPSHNLPSGSSGSGWTSGFGECRRVGNPASISDRSVLDRCRA